MIPPRVEILDGDVRARLAELPENWFHMACTSPPYWKLRRYMPKGSRGARFEIGSEPTFEGWIAVMVEVLDGVRRVLRPDGTLWLNLGDSYNTNEHGPGGRSRLHKSKRTSPAYKKGSGRGRVPGLKHKDLIGQPWALAFALRSAGWFLRSEIIWAKPNPLPESTKDRPTKAHEHIFLLSKSERFYDEQELLGDHGHAFLLSKSERYFYDQDAVREPASDNTHPRGGNATPKAARADGARVKSAHGRMFAGASKTRNLRSVWTFPTESAAKGSEHFATFPRELPERCVLAGTSERGACAGCGAPWKRVKERASGGSIGKSWHPHEDDARTGNVKASTANYEPGRTIGWKPSCRCEADGSPLDAIPCTVLDPFSGTGTTGVAALRFGRSYVGIELNPKSAAFSRERLARANEEFSAPIFERAASAPLQRDMFEGSAP